MRTDPNLDISNEGESDFIVEYVKSPEKPVWMNCLKTVILCILIFFGAAFTIMAFNNDVGVTDVLQSFISRSRERNQMASQNWKSATVLD